MSYQIVVCAGIVPDPLQTLEPVRGPSGPALKNEAMLPHVLDPWAACALYEAAHLAGEFPGSKVWLLSLAPKTKLQQVIMSVAQKAAFELLPLNGSSSGFADSTVVAGLLAETIAGLPSLDRNNLLVFGGWESAARSAGTTLQMVGERLGILDQFQGVDQLRVLENGALEILERVEGGRHQLSLCDGPPVILGWATGNLPEPPNNPQVGVANMRTLMPVLQRAKTVPMVSTGLSYESALLPKQQRATRIVKDMPVDDVARELAAWIRG
jgi:electron transfer flavoprotein beta subunit